MMIIKKFIKNKKGNTHIIVMLALSAIMGFSALVVDVGIVFAERSKLINALDAAVLAGAQELPLGVQKSRDVAEEYLEKNGVKPEDTNIVIKDGNTRLEIESNRNVDLVFGKILGFDNTNITASSKALVGAAGTVYAGIRPVAIESQSIQYGQRITLKESAGNGYSGNYGAIALGGRGANTYRENIKFGYKGKLKIGDKIDTEPGNMAGPTDQGVDYVISRDPSSTFDNYPPDSERVWIIPVVDSLEVNGRKPVTIVGFAAFFIEDADSGSGNGKGKGNGAEITGRFIEFITNADIESSQTDYGVKGVKLTH